MKIQLQSLTSSNCFEIQHSLSWMEITTMRINSLTKTLEQKYKYIIWTHEHFLVGKSFLRFAANVLKQLTCCSILHGVFHCRLWPCIECTSDSFQYNFLQEYQKWWGWGDGVVGSLSFDIQGRRGPAQFGPIPTDRKRGQWGAKPGHFLWMS